MIELNRAEIGVSVKASHQPRKGFRALRFSADPRLLAVVILAIVKDRTEERIIILVVGTGENGHKPNRPTFFEILLCDPVSDPPAGDGVEDCEDCKTGKKERVNGVNAVNPVFHDAPFGFDPRSLLIR